MNNLQTFHQQFPDHNVEDLLAEAKEIFMKNEQAFDCSSGYAKIPNKSFIKARMIVQDNGYSPHYVPLSKDAVNKETGEKSDFNFLFAEDIQSPWKFVDDKVTNVIEKQRHCCILVPEEDDIQLDSLTLSEIPPIAKELLQKKLPEVPISLIVALKVVNREVIPLNEIIDVFGVIEYPVFPKEDDEIDILHMEDLIPTIHCIHYNFYTPQINGFQSNGDSMLSNSSAIAEVRNDAISSLQSVLLGDRLAAEYLYVSLFSKITKRLGGIATGSINLNFYHPDLTSIDCAKVLNVIKKMTLMTAMLPVNIDTLNKTLWMQPHQNRYENTDYGLCRGEFQAPNGTFFLLDESKMEPGTLLERGVINMKTLQEAIDFGKVEYGLPFGTFSQNCDFRFTILGRSKSLLSPKFFMKLVPHSDSPKSTCTMKTSKFVQELVHSMNTVAYNVDDAMMEIVHEDFAKSQKLKREAQQPADDGTDLLNRLILAENIAKSFGLSTLTVSVWEHAGVMESERKMRLSETSFKAGH